MMVLHVGNKTRTINEICEVIDCEHKTAPYVESSEYLVVRTSNVRDGMLLLDDIKYTTQEGFEKWTQRAVPEYGDVLFTREAPAGESCLVPKELKVCMGQRMVLLRPKREIVDPIFLSQFLTTEKAKREIYRYSIGSTVTRINMGDIYKINVSLPSLEMQQKIATFLGSVNAKLDALRRKRTLLAEYKRGVMQKLFSQEIRFRQDDGRPFPDWETLKLSKVAKIYDGTHQTPKYVEAGVPFYSVEHITANNFENTKFISETAFIKECKRVRLERNDILMSRIGDIGTCRLIDWDVRASFYVSLALIKCKGSIRPDYLAQFIQTTFFQRELHHRTIHVAFPRKINLGEIGKCDVRIPHPIEQKKIADFLTAIDEKIATVDQQITQMETFKKGLLQQMFV